MDRKSKTYTFKQCRICKKNFREQLMAKQRNIQTLTETDAQLIGGIIDKKLEPLRSLLQMHDQTLYGENKDNGLKGDVNKLKEESIDQFVFKREVKISASLIALITSLLISFIGLIIAYAKLSQHTS